MTRPNLLFIMTDHQRADSLGMVQSGVEVTPSLNRFVSQSMVFTRAYTACPLCVPARTALATGKYPTRNGVVFNDWVGEQAGEHKPLHQYLDEAGYEVAHIGLHHIRVKPPLEQRVNFARWLTLDNHRQYLQEKGLGPPPWDANREFQAPVMEQTAHGREAGWYSNTRTAVWPSAPEHFLDNYLCREAAAFLRQPRNKPFALFLCLLAPHPPLCLPEPYASLFDPASLDLPDNVGVTARGEPANRRQGVAAQMAFGVSMEQWRKVWAAHLGLVRLADDGIGRPLQALADAGSMDNSIVVFTSDHGEHLGQHLMYQKMEMYEPAVRVPLLVRLPGADPGTVDTPVSHLDLMPTLLEALGIPDRGDLDGESLLETIKTGRPPADRPVFMEYSGNPALGDIRRAVVTRRYKYVYDPLDVPELYDLQADPLEMNNLAGNPAHAGSLRCLHDAAADWARKHGDWVRF